MTHADALATRHLKGALARHDQLPAGLVDGRGWTRRRGNHAQVTGKTGIKQALGILKTSVLGWFSAGNPLFLCEVFKAKRKMTQIAPFALIAHLNTFPLGPLW